MQPHVIPGRNGGLGTVLGDRFFITFPSGAKATADFNKEDLKKWIEKLVEKTDLPVKLSYSHELQSYVIFTEGNDSISFGWDHLLDRLYWS